MRDVILKFEFIAYGYSDLPIRKSSHKLQRKTTDKEIENEFDKMLKDMIKIYDYSSHAVIVNREDVYEDTTLEKHYILISCKGDTYIEQILNPREVELALSWLLDSRDISSGRYDENSDSQASKNYEWFVCNYKELSSKYGKCFVLIKDQNIVGTFDSFGSAYKYSVDELKYALGEFSIQELTGTNEMPVAYIY